jgi:sugar/nucleoside kinase (ribokinase family)
VELPGLFARARAIGLSTSLDTNYDPSEQWSGVDELLPVTDVFLPNEAEACSLSHSDAVDRAAGLLAGRVDTLVIKLGARGALGVSKGDWVRAASIPAQVVDTIGAGDSFDAGFLFGYLNHWPLARSLRLATICGALSTQTAGGINAQPTLQQAMERMDFEDLP